MLRRSIAPIRLLGLSSHENSLSEARSSSPIALAGPENGTRVIGGVGAGAGAGVRGRGTPTDVKGAVDVDVAALTGGCDAWDVGSFCRVGNTSAAGCCWTAGGAALVFDDSVSFFSVQPFERLLVRPTRAVLRNVAFGSIRSVGVIRA